VTVSTEILAILVTINCAIMGANSVFMHALWTDIKNLKQSHADTRVELERKADVAHDCKTQQKVCRDGLINQLCSKIETLKTENTNQHGEMWDRINHHEHRDDGKVVIG
jgi:hypothetical protein